MHEITYSEAIREATARILRDDQSVILIGEGVPDPKAVFGTTKGLQEKFGKHRVFDMPVSENGLTGICIGLAIQGIKPILVHQRIDFSLYAMDQLINNAAKWHSMFGGQAGTVPMVVRCIVGRGWGQGNQHSQNLSHIYATIPGLKVVCPATAKDAYELLISSVKDPGPVIFVEHRWLHNTTSYFSEVLENTPLGKGRVAAEGTDLTIVAWSYMVVEALKVKEELKAAGISIEVLDLRTIRPLDIGLIKDSVRKTKKLVVLEEAWNFNSLSSEIITQIIEDESIEMTSRPKRITLPDFYAPSTPHLSQYFYPNSKEIITLVLSMLPNIHFRQDRIDDFLAIESSRKNLDVPDASFKGPF